MILENLKGLGPKRISALHAANIFSLRDVLYYFPYRYKDTTKIQTIASVTAGDTVCLEGFIEKISTQYFNGLNRTIACLYDQTGSIKCTWYNSPWIKNKLIKGKKTILYGKVYVNNATLYLNSPSIEDEKGIIPVYKKISDISSALFQKLVKQIIETYDFNSEDFFTEELVDNYNLLDLRETICAKHYPENFEILMKANQRLMINQILIYLNALESFKKFNVNGISIIAESFSQEKYWLNYPFAPTPDQKRVLQEIIADLESKKPLLRLVQGDVGSGKTAVAYGAALYVVMAGYQCAFMAPTEILARQLYQGAVDIFRRYGFEIALLNSKINSKEKQNIYSKLERGEIQMVVGTHALFSAQVKYHNLGLIITDEQHRFGVAQRKMLEEKKQEKQAVNVLVMSATPIPRSMALVMLSDLDVSIIEHMPSGRIPVNTALVPEYKRQDMYRFIREQIKVGKQAFIVCKHIENKEDNSDIIDVKTHYKELSKNEFSDLHLGLLHGKQKQAEKENAIEEFSKNHTQILVSTTVIEVGVNIPNASIIVIENAEMYGLAQLHQLRGRVGRDGSKAWCFLMAKTNEKLKQFSETNDGFEISKIDFLSRGPGEILGFNQHGESALSTLLLKDSSENIILVSKKIFEYFQKDLIDVSKKNILNLQSEQLLGELKEKITFA